MPSILEAIFKKKLNPPYISPIQNNDIFGNNALVLACIKRSMQENLKYRKKQYQIVKQLLMYRHIDVIKKFNSGLTNFAQIKNEFQYSDNDYGDEVDVQKKSPTKAYPSDFKRNILNSIDVNASNTHTQFTALHWACVHGAQKIVRMLLENGAIYFLQDSEGYFPIDYAGMFNHKEVVKIIIEKHCQHFDKMTEQFRIAKNQEAIMREETKFMNNVSVKAKGINEITSLAIKSLIKIEIRKYQLFEQGAGSQLLDNAPLFMSPIFNTRILYWACCFNNITEKQIQDILKNFEAYPEGPVAIDQNSTPLHAAAKIGNVIKLRILLEDVKKRYQCKNQDENIEYEWKKDIWSWKLQDGEGADLKYKKRNIYPQTQAEMAKTLIDNYTDDTSVAFFFELLQEYRERAKFDERCRMEKRSDGQQFNYDFMGNRNNTPLHIASQFGNHDCVQELLKNDFALKTDIRNLDGLMPLDMIHNNQVRDVYTKYFQQLKAYAGRQIATSWISPEEKQQLVIGSSSNSVQPIQINQDKYEEHLFHNQRDQLKIELIQKNELLPIVPPLVLKVSVGINRQNIEHRTQIVNNMVQLLVNYKFIILMFESIKEGDFFIGLQLNDIELEQEAYLMEYRVKLVDVDGKKAYNPAFKKLFEPFRSKDIQQIILNRVQRKFNILQYKEEGILLSIIPMHDFSGIADIQAQWYRQGPYVKQEEQTCLRILKRWVGLDLFNTMPLPMIRQFYKESNKYDYNELGSIKNYFGEKVGFHYVWMSFYTVWLLIPVLGGLAITFYQIYSGVDSSLNTLYALLVCIWVTVFIERWKRKSSEICLKWGLSDIISTHIREERSELLGYEYFSHDSHKTEKKTFYTNKMKFGLFLQVPVFIILIGGCILTFFAFQWIKNYEPGTKLLNSLVQIGSGIVNTIIIMIFDYLYSLMATFSVNMENHKYQDSYERSYVYKMFIFKFINSNIQIFYQAFKYKDFDKFYYMLLGMAGTKAATILLMKHGRKLLTFAFVKWRYYSQLEKKARDNQKFQFQQQPKNIEDKNQVEDQKKSLVNKNNQNEIKNPLHQRHVLWAGLDEQQSQQKSKVFTDYIELNDSMKNSQELDVINERSDVFILFSLATLYSCACPIVPLIVMIHNIIDMNLDLYVSIRTTRRPFAKVATNIDPWLEIASFMAIAAVISNCLLLFFSTDELRIWTYKQFGVDYYQQKGVIAYCDSLLKQQGFFNLSSENYTEINLLWILVGVEHAIIIIKQFMAEAIPDSPDWVVKALLRVERQKNELGKADVENERKQQIDMLDEVKRTLKEQASVRTQKLEDLQETFKKLEGDKKMRDERIRMLEAENKEMQVKIKAAQAEGQKQVKEIGEKFNKRMQWQEKEEEKGSTSIGSLGQYLGISSIEWLGEDRIQMLDKELNMSIQGRLIYQTFTSIEREVISNRLGKIFDTKLSSTPAITLLSGGLHINCAQCQKSLAILECIDCVDHFCKPCSDQIHNNKEICKDHKFIELNIQINNTEKVKWKKFEYFNFPVLADNAPYQTFQLLFYYLQNRYLDSNYIEPTTQRVNLQSLFINRNYEMLTDIQAKILKAKDQQSFSQVNDKMLKSAQCFNDEEMFYINKIAFFMFQNKGHSLNFQQFTKTLSVFQSGPFLQRCTLWLHILCKEAKMLEQMTEGTYKNQEEDYVTRRQLEEVTKFSFLQRRPEVKASGINTNQVIEEIFKVGAQIAKEKDASKIAYSHKISIHIFMEVVSRNEQVREFMAALLQFRTA